VVTVPWASILEQMLPWLIALGTFAVAIGIGAMLASGDAAEEHGRGAAPVAKSPFLPRQRRMG
jgi:hypothetical protein